jgi:hypothetical protein
MPARILARDQDREVECVSEVERRSSFAGRFGDEQIAALECAAEDRVGRPAR